MAYAPPIVEPAIVATHFLAFLASGDLGGAKGLATENLVAELAEDPNLVRLPADFLTAKQRIVHETIDTESGVETTRIGFTRQDDERVVATAATGWQPAVPSTVVELIHEKSGAWRVSSARAGFASPAGAE